MEDDEVNINQASEIFVGHYTMFRHPQGFSEELNHFGLLKIQLEVDCGALKMAGNVERVG